MLNEDLLDPKDREIIKLKLENERLREAIQSFKEYDEERKKYYADISVRVGELESYIEELEQGETLKKLIAQNKMYKQQLQVLNARVYVDKCEMSDIKIIETAHKLQLANNMKKLYKEIKHQKWIIDNLLSKINNGEQKIKSPDSMNEWHPRGGNKVCVSAEDRFYPSCIVRGGMAYSLILQFYNYLFSE